MCGDTAKSYMAIDPIDPIDPVDPIDPIDPNHSSGSAKESTHIIATIWQG